MKQERKNMNKKLTIGVLIGNANSPYTKALMKGIYNAAEKMDVNIIFFLGVHMTSYFREYLGTGTENQYDYQYNVVYDYVRLSDVDGLIISYGSLGIFLEDNNKERFIDKFRDIPYVLIEERDEKHMGSSIISDNYMGMYQIVEHLVCVHNCRRLCLVAGPDTNTDAEEREQAFRDVLKKYGIDFSDDMIAKGDFSQCCGRQIGELLDRIPDADALVCANDVMADTAYKECTKRNLIVGKDIAITGYDDWEKAESMLPPLTTVLQSGMDMGYESIVQIIALCNGNPPVEMKAKTVVKIRSSCGCKNSAGYHFREAASVEELATEDYIKSVVEELCQKALYAHADDDIRMRVIAKMSHVLKICTDMYQSLDISQIDKKEVMDSISELFCGKCSAYLSITAMADGINEYVRHISAREYDEKRLRVAAEMSGMLQQYIQSCAIMQSNAIEEQYEQDTIFVPLISQDMLSHIEDEEEFYKALMYILNVLHVKSAYLYVLDQARKHYYGENWECPDSLNLAAYLEDGNSVSFAREAQPLITKEKGMVCNLASERKRMMTALNLFLGEEQYGVLLVEIEPKDMLLMHLVSMQISGVLNFYNLYKQQIQMQKRLESLVSEVNEKNQILGYISTYDELTGVLNRRGFMEKAIQFIHSEENNAGILVIADLDHLKEINDGFGHVEGDYAIRSAAAVLKQVFGEEVLVARIGGDEFAVMMSCEQPEEGDIYLQNIKEACKALNATSDKEFYVEISAGYTVFQCDPSVDFNHILSNSDKMLYKAKQFRRKSVRKEN